MLAKLQEIYNYRSMLRSMVVSDLRTRYKGSFFGFLWTFINPLLTLIVYSLVFSIVMRVNIQHYSVFMFVGLLSWNLFSTSIQSSATIVVRQGSLVKKIYFPREILPISVVIGGLINYGLSLIVLVPFLLLNGFLPTWYWLYIPLIILVEVLFTLGLSLIVSSANVYMRDVEHILSIVLMLWFYLTPVVYSLSMIPLRYAQIFKLNPMTDIVLSIQSVLYYDEQPHWKMFLYSVGAGILTLGIGFLVFSKLSRRFAEEV